ncbi:MAG: major capsid protein [Candidatus Azobacteroides sp.]|nr:major capsid protein [Candidatus Azobacteroides sp.]
MERSLFIKWLDKYYKGIVVKTVETLNGKNNEQALTYMFKAMLRKEFSVTGKWEAINTLSTRVSADVVSMDSSLPLKFRDSISKASGDIAKSGMELWLNETQLTELNTLIATKVDDKVIIAKIFQDMPRVITGIYELMENLFLQGLSTGVIAVEDSKNTGTGIRLDFGYLDANKFGVSILWDNANAKPLDDIARILKKAKHTDGNTITDVYMDDITFENFVKTSQVKEFFAFSIGFFGDKTIVPIPTLEKINAALKADNRYKFEIHIVDRTVIVEKNGKREPVTPWNEGKIILTTSKEVGVLAYARLAEQDDPVAGVNYQTADDYILVSKFRENRPSLKEYTTSQARVVPVICNVEQIYQLDSKAVQA